MWERLPSQTVLTVFVVLMYIRSAEFPRQPLTLEFITKILTTLLNWFWKFVRRLLRSEHHIHVQQKHQNPILTINNTIRMMLQNNLTQMMILLCKLQCTEIRTMPCNWSVRIVPCGLNSLSTGRVFWKTSPPILQIRHSAPNVGAEM